MKIIENHLLAITNTLFRNKNDYEYLTDKQKNDNFFIIKRYLSKSLPELMLKINSKNIDPISGMDLIYYHFYNKVYPEFFWSKTPYVKEVIKHTKDEILLMERLEVSYEELNLLKKYFTERLEDELKYFKMLEKEYKKK